MSNGNDEFVNGVEKICIGALICAAIGAVGFVVYWVAYGVVYAIAWSVPYLIFCVLPFVAVSFSLGFLLARSCRDFEWRWLQKRGSPTFSPHTKLPSEILSKPKIDYRRLAVYFPVAVIGCFFIFKAPGPREVTLARASQVRLGEFNTYEILPEPDSKAEVEKVESTSGNRKNASKKGSGNVQESEAFVQVPVIRWRKVYLAFNRFNSKWQNIATILKGESGYEPVYFDRSIIALVAWLAVLVGTPFVFFWFSNADVENEKRRLESEAGAAVNEQKEIRRSVERKSNEREAKWQREERALKALIRQEEEKVQALRAKLEFAPPETPGLPVKISKEEVRKKGVLDGDLF